MWNQYFNHYQPRQTEITKIKLATLKDLRKNWTRDISECIKLLKCKLIQILKRSLNLRDCFSHFVLKNSYYRYLYFFLLLLFYPWATPQVLTVDQLKNDWFSLCKKKWYHKCLSICPYCYFIQEACHRFRKEKNQLFGTTDNLLTHFEWANADEKVFMCLLKEVSVIVARRMLFKRNTGGEAARARKKYREKHET